MRKTNKKLSSLLTAKSGVILVTVIFIVAMALILITTALMISIAGRRRVYTNTVDSQARLTVTSLSQTIWQAIYSQQINDNMLVALAKGNGGNGSLVYFQSNDLPGMSYLPSAGSPDAKASAYFYCINAGDPSKIGIECKCEIDGVAEYYTLVLERERGEDLPPSSFNTLVELGGGGVINNVNFGVNVDFISNNERDNQVSYDAVDNVVFIHRPNYSTTAGIGIYSTLITDGPLAFGDVIFARNAFFVGDQAGYVFGLNGNQNNPAKRNTDGTLISTNPSGTPQYGNLYFYGTNAPFYGWGGAAPVTIGTDKTLKGVGNIYFDLRDVGGTLTGFGSMSQTFTDQFFDDTTVTGNVFYEDGITVNTSGLGSSDPHFNNEGTSYEPTVGAINLSSYLTPGDMTDTVGEVTRDILPRAAALTAVDINLVTELTSMSGGNTYYINESIHVEDSIPCSLASGDIYVVVAANKTLSFGGDGNFIVSGGTASSNFIIILMNGAKVITGVDDALSNPDDGALSGIVDTTVFKAVGTPPTIDYTNVHCLDQTKAPRVRILSTYTGGTQVTMRGNNHNTLTAFVGLYPTTEQGAGGGTFAVYNCINNVYYGRLACGSYDNFGSGNYFNIPYCPNNSTADPTRATALRDNTDFAVVSAESGYFTIG